MKTPLRLRNETPADIATIHELNQKAFSSIEEADLVNKIREQNIPHISVVAEAQSQIIGHCLLSIMTCQHNDKIKIYGLAPMSVFPDYQKMGIGKKLVTYILDLAKKQNIDLVFVLGHPTYYPKFGFTPCVTANIHCQYNVPDDVFMFIDLSGKNFNDLKGQTVYYSEPFADLG